MEKYTSPHTCKKKKEKKKVKCSLELVKRENLPRFRSSSSTNSSFHFLCLSEKFELQIKIILVQFTHTGRTNKRTKLTYSIIGANFQSDLVFYFGNMRCI